MAPTYDLNITQGSTAVYNITLNDADGAPMDFTGLSVRGSIKFRYSDSTSLATFSPTVNSNIVTISLTSAQTMPLPVGTAIYDLEKYSTLYDAEVILSGKVFIYPEVTKT